MTLKWYVSFMKAGLLSLASDSVIVTVTLSLLCLSSDSVSSVYTYDMDCVSTPGTDCCPVTSQVDMVLHSDNNYTYKC